MNTQYGRIIKITEMQTGTSKTGKEWVKQSFVVDKETEYNNEICFNLFGDYKVGMLDQFKVGDQVEVHYNVSSREYQGNYYTSADAFRILKHLPLNPRDEQGNFIEQVGAEDLKDDVPF
jgi:hypothetical protein